MPFLDIPGGRLHYEVQGDGYPVLLFAPGFLSSRIERWRTNPARPGVPQDWLDPIGALSGRYRMIALDVRNAGESRGGLCPGDDWASYTADHLALLDHLGVARCHVMGACIGVSFAYALAAARPNFVSAMVLQNPIGLSSVNREALDQEFDKWAAEVRGWPGVDERQLPGFRHRMFGGDFIFSVSRDFVAHCAIPTLLMPGDDLVHPAEVSADIARAPGVEMLAPWKGITLREGAMQRVGEFLARHTEAPQ
jgi:pimeloyl-ACP methyl ester carboxylesterase